MFSKETQYALRALVYIRRRNRENSIPGVEEISREIESPRFFTAKILHRMVRLGFLSSRKGRNGGFFFKEEQQGVTLKQVIEAIEGDKIFTGCGFGLKSCDETNPCPLHQEYAPIRDAIASLSATKTIDDLAGQENK